MSVQLFRQLFRTFLALSITIGMADSVAAFAAMQPDSIDYLQEARKSYKMATTLRAEHEYAEADKYMRQAQQLYLRLQDWNMVVQCATVRCQINYDFGYLDSMELLLKTAQAVVDEQQLRDENFKQERLFYFQALFFEASGEYQLASDYLDRAVNILKAVKNPIDLDSAFMSSHLTLSGSIYYDRRDFDSALRNYQTALTFFPQSKPNQQKLLIINNNIALAHIDQGEARKGILYLEKSLAILPELDPAAYYDEFLQTYFNLVKGKLQLYRTDEAIAYLDLAQDLLRLHPADRHIWSSLWAQVEEQKQNWNAALQHYREALEERKLTRGPHHPSIARLHHAIGRLASQLGQIQPALDAFQQGLEVLDRNFTPSDPVDVPSVENISDLYLLFQLLKDKGDLLRSSRSHHPAQILPTYRVAIQAIDSLRSLYESDASKLLLSKEAKSVFASAIELLFELYQQDHRQQYLEEAFQYMEKSKSLLLLENIRKWRNIRISRPDEDRDGSFGNLVEKEKNAKLDLLLLQRTIDDSREQTRGSDPAKLVNLEKALRKANASYQAIKAELLRSFPQYYEASYDNDVTTLRQIQRELLKNRQTALLSYFIFGSQSFVMLIRKDRAFLERIAAPEQWQDNFSRYQNSLRAEGEQLLLPDHFQTFVTASSQLYQELLQPLEPHIDDRCDRLYLVPDDILGFLAFESLLVQHPSSPTPDYSPANLAYLIEQFALAYGYSATLLVESLKIKHTRDSRSDYGGFAPVFEGSSAGTATSRDCTTGTLMYLPYSGESVTQTSDLFQGDAYLNEAASLANFRAFARGYRIIQLSTHACVDPRDALFNVIYFHDTTLATYEIFDIPLQADLVILSACETGNGDLLEGEGIMSLSRGFYYAGSANVVTSLWPADDHATKELMVRFNRYLKKGMAKDQALRKAKLDYLAGDGLRQVNYAPAIWANFILIGNQEHIDFGLPVSVIYLLAFALLAAILLISYRLYRSAS